MRINLGRAVVGLAGVVGVAGMAALAAAGCGGDDTTGPTDSGTDTTSDVSQDVSIDSPVIPDAGPDHDAAADVAADVAPDTADSAAPTVPADYATQLAVAFCQRLKSCCNLMAGDTWDESRCVTAVSNGGSFRGIGFFSASFADGGPNVGYDPALGAKCIADLGSFNCGVFTATQVAMLQSECFGAISPKLMAGGGPCTTSIECPATQYCKAGAGADGGAACTNLLANGTTCTHTINDECTHVGTGAPPSYCNLPGDGDAGACAATKALDAGCVLNMECNSGLCRYNDPINDPSGLCGLSEVVSDPGVPNGTCFAFTIRDAGGGG